MKTIFDKDVRAQLIRRIEKVNEGLSPEWGKMNVLQMLQHNTYWNEWIIGKNDPNYKQVFMGKIFGKIALNRMIKDDKPLDKNIPTSSQFKAKGLNIDLNDEKSKWALLVREYEFYHNPEFRHDFFGKMTKEQIGILVYKHTDHHLRQFGI